MFRVSVSGTSMYPVLRPNDCVIAVKREFYAIGAILIFSYGNEGCLSHQLLKAIDDKYYCKGDNSFRLEVISNKQIMGQAVFIERGGKTFSPAMVDDKFIKMSFRIYKEFVLSGYDRQKVMETQEYIEYRNLYLKAR